MSRPPVSVVMPFAGDERAAREAMGTLAALETQPGDQLIFANNAGVPVSDPRLVVVRASGEQSPAHARNTGALQASNDWILFLDADTSAPADLLDEYFAEPIADDVGALAGEVVPAAGQDTLAARYGASKGFLSQAAHLAHPYLPRAVAANLLVRRAAFEQLGGFYEGLRAAEDTDFSWRLQQAGWRLELCTGARVEHRYRSSVRELRSQWRGYAAGRAWLRRRYREFTPEPAARRAVGRVLSRGRRGRPERPESSRVRSPRRYLVLDAMLGMDELAGFALSNRPVKSAPGRPARVVLVADRFPARGDPLVDFARTLGGVRVEASARPAAPWAEVARELDIAYREDDGFAARILAVAWLLLRHPLRSLRDLLGRPAGGPKLIELAPVALRLERAPRARVHPLGGEDIRDTARRLAELSGQRLDER
jgi:Glycosyl transferase family group 2